MLAVSYLLPVFHMFRHVFQEDLFHDLTGQGGEADWLVVPRVFLFTLFKNGRDVSLFPVTGGLTA